MSLQVSTNISNNLWEDLVWKFLLILSSCLGLHVTNLYMKRRKYVGIGNTGYILSQRWDGTIDISNNVIVVYIILCSLLVLSLGNYEPEQNKQLLCNISLLSKKRHTHLETYLSLKSTYSFPISISPLCVL